MTEPTLYTLDANGLYDVALRYDAAAQTLYAKVGERSKPSTRLKNALNECLSILGSDEQRIEATTLEDGTLQFHPVSGKVTLALSRNRTREPLANLALESMDVEQIRPLYVSETRRMGSVFAAAPYSTKGKDAALIETAKTSVTTDYHTHSSGQISAKGLIELGIEEGAYYPIDMLREAGIDTSKLRFPPEARKLVPRVPFPPLDKGDEPKEVYAVALADLTEDERAKLALKMNMPADGQSTYAYMEYDAYRFRYPLSKQSGILRKTILKMAEEYAAQGITDAEVTMVGIDSPALLQTLHEAMDEIAANPRTQGMHMRYLMGIPRSWPQAKIEEQLEIAKLLSTSPYVAGIDFIGYEINRTKDFEESLETFAGWVNEHSPGFVLRMHAGENDKNLENVRDILELAKRHDQLRIRIGHGIYGMDDDTLKLARDLCRDPENPRVVLEFNTDSNIALNNTDDVTKAPVKKALANGIPFVAGSDGAGIYQTTAEQLGMNLLFAGLDGEGFEALRQHQENLNRLQRQHAEECTAKIPNWPSKEGKETFVGELAQQIGAVRDAYASRVKAGFDAQKPPSREEVRAHFSDQGIELVDTQKLPVSLAGKVPVTLVGASGTSWGRIAEEHQLEAEIAIDLLVRTLNPETTYFVQGRHKPRGITGKLQQSLVEAQEAGEDAFYTLGMIAEPKLSDKCDYNHLTGVHLLDGKLLDVPRSLSDFTVENKGVLVGIGGAAFTRDTILLADQRGASMVLMEKPQGAAAEKAEVLKPAYRAASAMQVIENLYKHRPDLFRADFSLDQLETLYAQSEQRMSNRPEETPDPLVTVESGEEIAPDRGVGK